MFCLPAIGVSACARTIGHATSTRSSEASRPLMRVRVAMNLSAAMRQHPFSATAASRDLSDQAFRSLHTLHDSVRGRIPLPGVHLGAPPAVCKPLAGFAGRALGLEIDSSMFDGKGERFYFGGVKCKVPEVPHP